MLSKTKVKYIRSLELKKFRNENNVFVAEGNKLVADMLPAFECELLIAKPSWMATQGDIPAKELLVAEEDDIRKASFLKNPQDVLAIFKRPNWDITEITPEKELVLAVQATMGALAHVKIHYTDLETFLQAQSAQAIPLYGTFLGGENLYEKTLSGNGILIMGNEGNGIRPAFEAFVNEKLYIPNYPEGRDTSESLNVACLKPIAGSEERTGTSTPS